MVQKGERALGSVGVRVNMVQKTETALGSVGVRVNMVQYRRERQLWVVLV